MSLREEIQADLAEVMDGDLAEAVRSFKYTTPSGAVYSPTTGQVTNETTPAAGRGVFYETQFFDLPAVPPLEDISTKAVVLQNELAVAPLNGGKLETLTDLGATDETFLVEYVKPDPTNAIWELYLRRYTPTSE